jgi:RALGAPB N-terminal domain/Rap/ran-GAP
LVVLFLLRFVVLMPCTYPHSSHTIFVSVSASLPLCRIGGNRPPSIEAERDDFFKLIFCHVSLLFKPRTNASGASYDQHASLCRKALFLYRKASGAHSTEFSTSTWALLLKVLLGIADVLLEGPSIGSSLGNTLESELLDVVFDAWLRSKTQDAHLWELLSSMCSRVLHRKWVIIHWRMICRVLSGHLVTMTYGTRTAAATLASTRSTSNTITVGVQWRKDFATGVRLKRAELLYVWHQMLHIIRDPNAINDPETFIIAAECVAELTDRFLSVPLNIRSTGTSLPPNGESILQVFGMWLYDLSLNSCSGFEQGRACALGALCRIFTMQDGRGDCFRSESLAQFYRVLSDTLDSLPTDSHVVHEIVSNCAAVFASNLHGCRVLIPKFYQHLRYILSERSYGPELRASAIRIVTSMLTLNNHFFGSITGSASDTLQSDTNDDESEASLPSSPSGNVFRQANEMKRMLSELATVLINALLSENDAHNLEMILWAMCVQLRMVCMSHAALSHKSLLLSFNRATAASTGGAAYSSFPQLAISTVWKSLSTGAWPLPVTLTALRMLGSVAPLGEIMRHANSAGVTEFISELCRFAVHNQKRLMEKLKMRHAQVNRARARGSAHHSHGTLRNDTLSSKPVTMHDIKRSSSLVTDAMWCLFDWLEACTWIVADERLAANIMQCVLRALELRHGQNEVYNVSLSLFRFLMFETSSYPHLADTSRVQGIHTQSLASLAGTLSPTHPLERRHNLSQYRFASRVADSSAHVVQLSSSLNELDILKYLHSTDHIKLSAGESIYDPDVFARHVRFYQLDNRCILSAIEWQSLSQRLPSDGSADIGPPTLILIIRDATAKHVWQVRSPISAACSATQVAASNEFKSPNPSGNSDLKCDPFQSTRNARISNCAFSANDLFAAAIESAAAPFDSAYAMPDLPASSTSTAGSKGSSQQDEQNFDPAVSADGLLATVSRSLSSVSMSPSELKNTNILPHSGTAGTAGYSSSVISGMLNASSASSLESPSQFFADKDTAASGIDAASSNRVPSSPLPASLLTATPKSVSQPTPSSVSPAPLALSLGERMSTMDSEQIWRKTHDTVHANIHAALTRLISEQSQKEFAQCTADKKMPQRSAQVYGAATFDPLSSMRPTRATRMASLLSAFSDVAGPDAPLFQDTRLFLSTSSLITPIDPAFARVQLEALGSKSSKHDTASNANSSDTHHSTSTLSSGPLEKRNSAQTSGTSSTTAAAPRTLEIPASSAPHALASMVDGALPDRISALVASGNLASLLYRNLSLLDATSSRETSCITVLRRRVGQTSEKAILGNNQQSLCDSANDSLDHSFMQFVSCLGVSMNVKQHIGFRGGLTEKDADAFPYFSSVRAEMVFHVPSLMNCNITRRLRLCRSDLVCVLWSDDVMEIDPFECLPHMHAYVFIVIYPHETGLFRVRIHAGGHSSSRTPGSSGMSKHQRMVGDATGGTDEDSKDGSGAPLSALSPRNGQSVASYSSHTLPGGLSLAGLRNAVSPTGTSHHRKSRSTDVLAGDRNLAAAAAAAAAVAGTAHTMQQTNRYIFGPLLDDMVITVDALAELVRETCSNTIRKLYRTQHRTRHASEPSPFLSRYQALAQTMMESNARHRNHSSGAHRQVFFDILFGRGADSGDDVAASS